MRKKVIRLEPRDMAEIKARTAALGPKVNQAEEDIDRAVERVYRIYGPDLSVFFKAIQGQFAIERCEGELRRDTAPTDR